MVIDCKYQSIIFCFYISYKKQSRKIIHFDPDLLLSCVCYMLFDLIVNFWCQLSLSSIIEWDLKPPLNCTHTFWIWYGYIHIYHLVNFIILCFSTILFYLYSFSLTSLSDSYHHYLLYFIYRIFIVFQWQSSVTKTLMIFH